MKAQLLDFTNVKALRNTLNDYDFNSTIAKITNELETIHTGYDSFMEEIHLYNNPYDNVKIGYKKYDNSFLRSDFFVHFDFEGDFVRFYSDGSLDINSDDFYTQNRKIFSSVKKIETLRSINRKPSKLEFLSIETLNPEHPNYQYFGDKGVDIMRRVAYNFDFWTHFPEHVNNFPTSL